MSGNQVREGIDESGHKGQGGSMNPDQLKQLLRARGPVVLHLSSGREIVVRHTDYALFTPDSTCLAVAVTDSAFEIVAVGAIESVTPASANSAA